MNLSLTSYVHHADLKIFNNIKHNLHHWNIEIQSITNNNILLLTPFSLQLHQLYIPNYPSFFNENVIYLSLIPFSLQYGLQTKTKIDKLHGELDEFDKFDKQQISPAIIYSSQVSSESSFIRPLSTFYNINIKHDPTPTYVIFNCPYMYPHNTYYITNHQYLSKKILISIQFMESFNVALSNALKSNASFKPVNNQLFFFKSTKETSSYYEITLILNECYTLSYDSIHMQSHTIHLNLLYEYANTEYHENKILIPRTLKFHLIPDIQFNIHLLSTLTSNLSQSQHNIPICCQKNSISNSTQNNSFPNSIHQNKFLPSNKSFTPP